MIPLKLKIKGFYAFQEEQTIHFDTLIKSQLFGIFGSVGSGKSSVLEAITFALYGDSDRLNSRDNRNYNMMNLRSDELRIEFEFENYDQKHYLFTVQGKRNSKQFDKVSTLERSAYEWKSGEWVPLESASAEPLLDLTYDNFRRTIIIPQGKFQEFLQLTDKERTVMMKEIFHLGKYEYFFQTSALEKQNSERISHLDGQLEGYSQITSERIAEREKEFVELEKSVQLQKSELLKIETAVKQQEELKKTFDTLLEKQQQLLQFQAREKEIKEKEGQLRSYEYCWKHFKPALDRKAEWVDKISAQQHEQEQNGLRYRGIEKDLEERIPVYEKVKSDFENLEISTQKRDDYAHLIEVKNIQKEMDDLILRTERGKAVILQEKEKQMQTQREVDDTKQALKELKSALPDQTELGAVRNWFTQRTALESNLESFINEQKTLRNRLNEERNFLAQGVPKRIVEQVPDLNYEIEALQHSIDLLKSNEERAMENWNQQLNELKVKERLGQFRSNLKEGEECLLCGSVHHPNPLDAQDVTEHLLSVQDRITQSRELIRICDETQSQLIGNQARIDSLIQQSATVDTKIKELEEALVRHKGQFEWNIFNPEDQQAILDLQQKGILLQKEISSLELKLEQQEHRLKEDLANVEKYKLAIEEFERQNTVNETRKIALLEQIKQLSLSELNNPSEVLLQKQSDWDIFIRKTRETFESLTTRINALREEKAALSGSISKGTEILELYKRELQTVVAFLEKTLKDSPFDTMESVLELLKLDINVDARREEIEHFRNQWFRLNADIEQLNKEVAGKTFDAEAFTAQCRTFEELKNRVEASLEKVARENALLHKDKEDFKAKETLQIEKEKLQLRADNINIMKRMFKGSGFVNYISSVHLQNLCNAANQRFYKLTRNQFKLELTENNNFQVRDFLNNGRTRNVKTLSGGQTFQASLSLALALAESVQHQNKAKQNFFFLDEGFGSLDREALQIVFDTLKALRKENRIVGIISHVEDLQQEIDTYLKIVNHPEKGSLITRSWEPTS